ncbi:MAG: dockerin type I repeat-containing protein [Clostridia bacterium]|nr:dockerin type I repeat-containing protein [Clostridia bacterium]
MRYLKKSMTAVLAVILAFTLAVSGSAAFDFSSLIGGDPIRIFFTFLNYITTKEDRPSYTETPLDPVEYSAAELERRQKIVELINGDLNRIKTEKPAFTINANRGLPGSNKNAVLGYFNHGSSIADAIFRLLFGDKKNPVDASKVLESIGITGFFSDTGSSQHTLGTACDNLMSVTGASYVSSLRAEDVYNDNPVTKSRYNDSYDFRIQLQDAVNPGPDSAQARVFDLFSDVKLVQTIAGLLPQLDVSMLKLRYVDCYIEGSVDKNGNINQYTTHYKCVMQIDTSEMAYDLSQYLSSINNKEIYESEVTYTDFNWTPRLFGDVNADGRVNSADARVLLRIAARLDAATADMIPFGDMNFDGKLTSVDARILLRVASHLQDLPEQPTNTAV